MNSQPLRFAFVGLVTAVGYLAIAAALGQGLRFSPVMANFIAICLMHPVAYLSHRLITFKYAGPWRDSVVRFASVALATTLVSCVSTSLQVQWGVPLAIGLTLNCVIVPTATFLLMRMWVFARA